MSCRTRNVPLWSLVDSDLFWPGGDRVHWHAGAPFITIAEGMDKGVL